MKTLYCTDKENWTHADESLYEVIAAYFNDGYESEGGVVEVYVGNPKHYKASEFSPYVWDELTNQAYDVGGEHSESWCYSLKLKDEKELQSIVNAAIDKFFDERNNQPSFSTIENVKTINVRVYGEKEEYPYFECCEILVKERGDE